MSTSTAVVRESPPRANDGFYTDRINGGGPGTFTYQVCNAGTKRVPIKPR